jgi:hypothetical protein
VRSRDCLDAVAKRNVHMPTVTRTPLVQPAASKFTDFAFEARVGWILEEIVLEKDDSSQTC